jgi:hypothetical protein
MNNDDDGRAAFADTLACTGFSTQERNAFINQSGCTNIAMLGLLPSDQVSKICKRLTTRAVNPIIITAIQEQLLQAMPFWVSNLQRLQQPAH